METVSKTQKRLANLKPWKKGECPNINGRPNGQRNYVTIYREALKKIGEAKNLTPEEVEDLLYSSGLSKALKGDYNFFRDTLDRLHGKPMQRTETDITSAGEKLENPIVAAIITALQ